MSELGDFFDSMMSKSNNQNTEPEGFRAESSIELESSSSDSDNKSLSSNNSSSENSNQQKVVDLTENEFSSIAQSESPSAVLKAVLHLISHPERANSLMLDEIQFRKFLRRELSDLSDDEARIKIRAYQKLGVYLRVAEQETIRIKQEKDVSFLSKQDDRTYKVLSEQKKVSKAPRKSKKERFFEQKRKLNIDEKEIQRQWDMMESLKALL